MKPELVNKLSELLTIHTDHFVYTNVRAIIWAGNGLKSPSNIELNTGTLLSKIYLSQGTDKCLIVDFKSIQLQVDHSLDSFFLAMKGMDREVVFLNHDSIDESLHAYSRKYLDNRVINDPSLDIKHIKISSDDIIKKVPYLQLEQKVQSVLEAQASKWIKSCFMLFDSPKLLNSTPIKATGKFDALHLISDPKKFLWVCIMIARHVEQLKEKNTEELRILSVSLSASAIALTVGLLTELKVDLINQIGPETRIYDQDDLNHMRYKQSVYKYVYVGDFTISGTEIKIARAYVDGFSCTLNYAVVIGSLFDKEVFTDCFELYYLARLDSVTEEAKYSLPTSSLITI